MKLRTVCPHRNPVQKNLDGLLIKIFRNKFINSKYSEIVHIVIKLKSY